MIDDVPGLVLELALRSLPRHAVALDVTDYAATNDAVQVAVERFGRLDVRPRHRVGWSGEAELRRACAFARRERRVDTRAAGARTACATCVSSPKVRRRPGAIP